MVLVETKKVFVLLTENKEASNLFLNQLSTVLDDIFASKIGSFETILNQTVNNQQFINDLSETIYNELAFWKLMHNVDNMILDVVN